MAYVFATTSAALKPIRLLLSLSLFFFLISISNKTNKKANILFRSERAVDAVRPRKKEKMETGALQTTPQQPGCDGRVWLPLLSLTRVGVGVCQRLLFLWDVGRTLPVRDYVRQVSRRR